MRIVLVMWASLPERPTRSGCAHDVVALTVSLDCLFLGGHAGPVTASTNARVPQEERTRAMRQRLMEATFELLVEKGYGGTTTTLVSERAGVSRGAQLHHFPTKIDLVVATVVHVTERRGEELLAAAASVPRGENRTQAVVRMLGEHFAGPVFTAALELWVAARTDPVLLEAVAPLELRFGRETHRIASELLGADESRPGVRELVQATLDLVRGLGLANTISDDARRRRRILDQWARTLDAALHPGAPTTRAADPPDPRAVRRVRQSTGGHE
jgi:AcrR family transcriptional regulator